jgi:uncharacterized delta-60 repeat protein
MKYFFVTSLFLLVSLVGVLAFGSTGSVDPAFNATPSTALPGTNPVQQQLVQLDGKVVIWTGSLVVDGAAKGQIIRVNADGTLDSTFSYCNCDLGGISNVVVLADGRFLVAGTDANSVAKIVRLNADGSVDNTFSYVNPSNSFGTSSITIDAVQADGKIFGDRTQLDQGINELTLFRFNADGSVDTGFTPISYGAARLFHPYVTDVVPLPDGRFYVSDTTIGSISSTPRVRRFNGDGTLDNTWTGPTFSGNQSMTVADMALQADGALIISGEFSTVNGLPKADIARLLPAGNVDAGFTGPAVFSGGHVSVSPGGKILAEMLVDAGGTTKIFRLNSDGSTDGTFTMSASVDTLLNKFAVDGSGNIVFLGRGSGFVRFFRLSSEGALDASFDPNVTLFGKVYAMVRQTDGKIIIAGDFTQFSGLARPSLVRVNSDGTLDTSFNAGSGFDAPPKMLALQADGKILAVGDFVNYNGNPRARIARINADGSIDGSFTLNTSGVGTLYAVDVQTDGKIIVGGTFSSIGGAARPGLARLNLADGSVDASFAPVIGGTNIFALRIIGDGRIMIGGTFSGVDGFNRTNFVRLNSNASLDQTFNAGSITSVKGIWPQADGKYLYLNGTTLRRRNNDGTIDNGFVAPDLEASNTSDTSVNAVLLWPDGSILVGGRFDTAGGTARKNLVRLSSTGALDLFFLTNGADGAVRSIIDYPAGKAMIGGDFAAVENTMKDAIARIIVSPFANKTPFDFDGDGRADITVYRPSEQVWYELFTSGNPYSAFQFGLPGDVSVPGDYDGDGITDAAIWRPSTGDWWYRSSLNGAQYSVHWGTAGDIPRPSDWDGDGKTDFVVFRPSDNMWYRLASFGQTSFTSFGLPGDKPLVGDFDGDGKGDLAVFRPSTGTWWYAASASGGVFTARQWGQNGDIPVPADYDGDGKTDLAVFRPSEGAWYIVYSSNGAFDFRVFGLSDDRPVPADYDGDGRADIAVFRPSTGVWYLLQSTAGFNAVQWGVSTDVAAPAAYLP